MVEQSKAKEQALVLGDVSAADTGEVDGRGDCTAPGDKAVSLSVGISVYKRCDKRESKCKRCVKKWSQNPKGAPQSDAPVLRVYYEVRHILTHLLKKCVIFWSTFHKSASLFDTPI